ncbi:MAG TPA: hypothetical protein VGC27_09735, partial [Rhizomicrobium sp.]
KLPRDRPLLIVDADEVILRFTDGFDRFLRLRGYYLDLTSYRLYGNVKSLTALAQMASVVVLTNISEAQAPARRRNLLSLGLDYPLVVNEGLKGPAVKNLAGHVCAACFFIDDVPQHLASAEEMAPEVVRIHLVGDTRLAALLPLPFHAHYHTEDWEAAEIFIKARLGK